MKSQAQSVALRPSFPLGKEPSLRQERGVRVPSLLPDTTPSWTQPKKEEKKQTTEQGMSYVYRVYEYESGGQGYSVPAKYAQDFEKQEQKKGNVPFVTAVYSREGEKIPVTAYTLGEAGQEQTTSIEGVREKIKEYQEKVQTLEARERLRHNPLMQRPMEIRGRPLTPYEADVEAVKEKLRNMNPLEQRIHYFMGSLGDFKALGSGLGSAFSGVSSEKLEQDIAESYVKNAMAIQKGPVEGFFRFVETPMGTFATGFGFGVGAKVVGWGAKALGIGETARKASSVLIGSAFAGLYTYDVASEFAEKEPGRSKEAGVGKLAALPFFAVGFAAAKGPLSSGELSKTPASDKVPEVGKGKSSATASAKDVIGKPPEEVVYRAVVFEGTETAAGKTAVPYQFVGKGYAAGESTAFKGGGVALVEKNAFISRFGKIEGSYVQRLTPEAGKPSTSHGIFTETQQGKKFVFGTSEGNMLDVGMVKEVKPPSFIKGGKTFVGVSYEIGKEGISEPTKSFGWVSKFGEKTELIKSTEVRPPDFFGKKGFSFLGGGKATTPLEKTFAPEIIGKSEKKFSFKDFDFGKPSEGSKPSQYTIDLIGRERPVGRGKTSEIEYEFVHEKIAEAISKQASTELKISTRTRTQTQELISRPRTEFLTPFIRGTNVLTSEKTKQGQGRTPIIDFSFKMREKTDIIPQFETKRKVKPPEPIPIIEEEEKSKRKPPEDITPIIDIPIPIIIPERGKPGRRIPNIFGGYAFSKSTESPSGSFFAGFGGFFAGGKKSKRRKRMLLPDMTSVVLSLLKKGKATRRKGTRSAWTSFEKNMLGFSPTKEFRW